MSVEQVFALSDDKLGETELVEHCIDTGGAKPVRTSPRRFPYSLRLELEEELRKLLRTTCIEPANSPYALSLVPVRKKDGSIRVCIDYRALNKDTVPDSYPIPRIDDLVDAIGRRKGNVFSSLDLMKAYHQVRMADTSKWKTAFTCHMGLFQYRRMPFGLMNAPATFQRLMNQLFQGGEWDFVFIYLDDILIVSSSVEEHRLHLKKVLQRLDEAGLRLKPSKYHFVKRQIYYLGYTVSPEGVLPNSMKVETVHPPDLPKEFYLWTDACELGFGAVLEQEGEDGHRHPIAFASRQTNEAERKYAPTGMEVAALVFAVEHFKVYLLGNKTIVYTDHQALVSGFLAHMKSQTKGLLARWYLRLSRFLPNLRLD